MIIAPENWAGNRRTREGMNMRIIKLSATFFAYSLFLMTCSSNEPQQTANNETYPNNGTQTETAPDQAKNNLDLRRVGNLLERSHNPREFETFLNSRDGIDNLDLNGDGYVDYIS